MASDRDTLARISELSKQNFQFADQATQILKGYERRLRKANPGFIFMLDEPVFVTEPIWMDQDRSKLFRESYRIGWLKYDNLGWSLVCAVTGYCHNGPISNEDGSDDTGWYRDGRPPQSIMIDSWPAAVRIAALGCLDELTQALFQRVEDLVVDRDETASLIQKYSYLAEGDDREGEGSH